MDIVKRYLKGIRGMAPPVGSSGATLIFLIVSMVAVAALGAGISYIMSSSYMVPVDTDLSQQAYYLAESGIRVINPPDQTTSNFYYQVSQNSCNSTWLNGLSTNTSYNKTLTLSNGNTIVVAASYSGVPQQVQVTSTGTAKGSSLSSSATVYYTIPITCNSFSTGSTTGQNYWINNFSAQSEASAPTKSPLQAAAALRATMR